MSMRIDEGALRQILQSYGPKGQGVPGSTRRTDPAATGGGDAITISNEGQELQRLIRAAQASDGVRSERVQELQSQLRTGGYVLDPELIAQSMLGYPGANGNG